MAEDTENISSIILQGWMAKQGHVVLNWKHRYFVLDRNSIRYFKDEPKGENEKPMGTIPLSKALIYQNVWAPQGYFGWMLKTASGRTYPFRCFELDHREAWVSSLRGVLLALDREEVDIGYSGHSTGYVSRMIRSATTSVSVKNEITATEFTGSIFEFGRAFTDNLPTNKRRSSGTTNSDSTTVASVINLEILLSNEGLRHLAPKFVQVGWHSVNVLCRELSVISDDQLRGDPFNLEENEVAMLRICMEKASGADQRADEELRKFLSQHVLTSYLEQFETYGVTNLTDLCDAAIVSDDDLRGPYFRMDKFTVTAFRDAVNNYHMSHTVVFDSMSSSSNHPVLVHPSNREFNFDEERESDSTFVDNFEESPAPSSITLTELLKLSSDYITAAQVSLGIPYIGRLGKRHPVFDIVLFGSMKTKRIRSFRFKTLRVFNNYISKLQGLHAEFLTSLFPETLGRSSVGVYLSKTRMNDRVVKLNNWMKEILRMRSLFGIELRRALEKLLQLDSIQLFQSIKNKNQVRTMTNHTRNEFLMSQVDESTTSGIIQEEKKQQNSSIIENDVATHVGTSNRMNVTDNNCESSSSCPSASLCNATALALQQSTPYNRNSFHYQLYQNQMNNSSSSSFSSPQMNEDEFEIITSQVTRGTRGLGMEVSPSGLGLLSLNITRPYKDVTTAHPADVAIPPLQDNDILMLVNGIEVGTMLETVMFIKDHGPCYEFTIKRLKNQEDLLSLDNENANVVEEPEESKEEPEEKEEEDISIPKEEISVEVDEKKQLLDDSGKKDKVQTQEFSEIVAEEAPVEVASSAEVNAGDGEEEIDALEDEEEEEEPTPLAPAMSPKSASLDGITDTAAKLANETVLPDASLSSVDEMNEDNIHRESLSNEMSESSLEQGLSTVEEEQEAFENFANSLRTGIEIVKINRRGQAAFRSIVLVGEHTLSWIAPTLTTSDNDATSKTTPASSVSQAKGRRRSFFASVLGSKNTSTSSAAASTVASNGDNGRGVGGYMRRRIGLAKEHLDVRELKAVRKGEDFSQEGGELKGTNTLRLHAKMNSQEPPIHDSGLALSLIFADRSVDLVADSQTQRDFLIFGFLRLANMGPSGGYLSKIVISSSENLGIELSNHQTQGCLFVAELVEGGVAYSAGLKKNDKIMSVNNNNAIKQWDAKKAQDYLSSSPSSILSVPFTMVVEREVNQSEVERKRRSVAQEKETMKLLRSAGLSAFETRILNYGISTIQQLANHEVVTDEVLSSSEIGMKPAQIKKLRRALSSVS